MWVKKLSFKQFLKKHTVKKKPLFSFSISLKIKKMDNHMTADEWYVWLDKKISNI